MLFTAVARTLAAGVALSGWGANLSASPESATTGTARESVLYSFRGGAADGSVPQAGLVADGTGTLYGTTGDGGASSACGSAGCGTVFALTPSGSGYAERVLYSFQGGSDGAHPYGGLTVDGSGALYGTTAFGGSASCNVGCGTVFKLAPSAMGYRESVVYSFQGGNDGANPYYEALIADRAGALYGTTTFGGNGSKCDGASFSGCGTVFKLTPSATGYTERVLYAFQGGRDGAASVAGLIGDEAGALYGTTNRGGSDRCGGRGCGTVFKLTPSGTEYRERILHSFRGRRDGGQPYAGLIVDASGALYGTTAFGGFHFPGDVFKLTPSGNGYNERILWQFGPGHVTGSPTAGLTVDAKGSLYGTAGSGFGSVFKLARSPTGYVLQVIHKFTGSPDGAVPSAVLITDAAGAYYGTTLSGGAYNRGTVFRVVP
jgi:uncharacterized repeat protein (TIGR03803 family)